MDISWDNYSIAVSDIYKYQIDGIWFVVVPHVSSPKPQKKVLDSPNTYKSAAHNTCIQEMHALRRCERQTVTAPTRVAKNGPILWRFDRVVSAHMVILVVIATVLLALRIKMLGNNLCVLVKAWLVMINKKQRLCRRSFYRNGEADFQFSSIVRRHRKYLW